MKRDIRINYSAIDEIANQVHQYKSAIEIMETTLKSIKDILETENSGDSITALLGRYESIQNKINSCKEELKDLQDLFKGYYDDMKSLVKPLDELDLVQVDKNDIWCNLQDIKRAINKVDNLKKEASSINVYTESYISPYEDMKVQYQWGKSEASTRSEEDEKNQQENVRKIDEIKDLIGQYTKSMKEQTELMDEYFNKYIAPFEEMDNIYASKTNPIYNKYSSQDEMRKNESDFAKEQSRVLAEGIWDNIVGAGKFAKGVIDYGVGAYSLGKLKIEGAELSEEDKKYINSFLQGNKIIKELIKDPYLIVEGMAQQTSDDLDQKGLSYVVGGAIADYFLFKIGKGIKVKVSNVVKLENVLEKVSALISKLKTNKLDDIFNIVEETVDKGDSILFKLEGGSETTISKAELKARGVSDSGIQYCIDGCFVGETLVLTEKGPRRIDEIQVGDFVYATDVKTGDKNYKEVLQVHKRNTYEFVKLNVEGEEIRTTPRHLFYTYEGTWKIAGELKPGDEILSSDGQAKKVISVKEELLEETERIYNLSIEWYNTYYVSEIGLLVHNQGCPGKKIKGAAKASVIESEFADISGSFNLEAAKKYERKIDNSKYFYHDEGDFGEEVAKKVAMDNNLGADVSSKFQSGRNGIDGAFLTKGPPPKLTMIESKASLKGEYGYSSQQIKGGKQYFDDMVNSKDPRYADFKKMIKKLEKENPGLIYDYISAETKIKITKVGFGVDEINIKDWTKPVD